MQSIAERSEQLPKDWQNNKHDNDEVVVVHNLWTHKKKREESKLLSRRKPQWSEIE